MTNSIKKGNQGQRDVANMFKRWFPNAQSSSHAQRNAQSKLPDIIGGVEEYFYVEVKRYKKIYPYMIGQWLDKIIDEWMEYYKTDSPDQLPLIVYRGDREEWLVYNAEYGETKNWQEFSDELDKKFEIHND